MDQDIFISEIKIKQLRHLHNITIPIVKESEEIKHLILTGKNGSGKTSLLSEIAEYIDLTIIADKNLKLLYEYVEKNLNDGYNSIGEKIRDKIEIKFNTSILRISNAFTEGQFIKAFFVANRNFKVDEPSGIEKIDLPQLAYTKQNNSGSFLSYLVFLRSKLTDASYRGDLEEVKKLETWFSGFEKTLRTIFNDESIKLKYNSSKLNFDIYQETKNTFDFNTLSDGYAAILRIISELMMRMENKKGDAYDVNGIVLIDEIETHLHIELQKSILPLLTAFFPKVQFIVTTHSPFILNSIENAVVYDLENHILFEDASEISYTGLIEKYFLTSQYSDLMESKIAQFENLSWSTNRSEAEDEKLADLLVDLKTLSPLLSPEMYNRFHVAQKKLLKPTPAKA